MRILLYIAICLFSFSALSQVITDKSIHFNSADSTKNQALYLGTPSQLDNSIPSHSEFRNSLIYTELDTTQYSNNTLNANLPIAPSAYVSGMKIYIKTSFTCSDSVLINLNGLGPVEIHKNFSSPLDSADIDSNQVVALIYDGTNFQFTNYTRKCPSGFVKVDASYCIEIDDNPLATIWDAILDCDTKGGSLCSLSEWYAACINAQLGLQNMTDNWEWINHGKDHTSDAAVAGDGQCDIHFSNKTELWQFQIEANYRCCYYR